MPCLVLDCSCSLRMHSSSKMVLRHTSYVSVFRISPYLNYTGVLCICGCSFGSTGWLGTKVVVMGSHTFLATCSSIVSELVTTLIYSDSVS